jgi:ATP-binding cassette subfamily F protein uup
LLAFTGDARLTAFADVAQWEKWQRSRLSAPKAEKPAAAASAPVAPESKKKLTYKDQRELDGMEAAIARAEAEVDSLTQITLDTANVTNAKLLSETYAKLQAAQLEVERLYQRWSELTS